MGLESGKGDFAATNRNGGEQAAFESAKPKAQPVTAPDRTVTRATARRQHEHTAAAGILGCSFATYTSPGALIAAEHHGAALVRRARLCVTTAAANGTTRLCPAPIPYPEHFSDSSSGKL